MSFCKFSASFNLNNKTQVDNAFISDYLPFAPNKCGETYLLGLMLCTSGDIEINSLEYISKKLEIGAEDVISCFKYWEEKGLVQVLSTDPIEVRYLPVSNANSRKLLDSSKYTNFNLQLQELFGKTMLMAYDYQEYYHLIEHKHMEQNALLEIVRYSIEYKGFNPSKRFALTLASDWEKEGIHTLEQVKQKIEELGLIDENVSLILKAIGSMRRIKLEDKELINKWLNSYGFDMNVILHVINLNKDKKRVLEMEALDKILSKYYEMKLTSVAEITSYEKEKENYYFIAVAINKELGIYYQDLTKEIDTYIVKWLNMGFDKETLIKLAENCFINDKRNLSMLNDIVNKFYRLGVVNIDNFNKYIQDNLAVDEKIKEILKLLEIERNVNIDDRNYFNTWTQDWLFDLEIIKFGASISKNAPNPMRYLNSILTNWHRENRKTLKSVQESKIQPYKQVNEDNFIHNNYTKEQIASFITNIDDAEV